MKYRCEILDSATGEWHKVSEGTALWAAVAVAKNGSRHNHECRVLEVTNREIERYVNGHAT